MKTAKEIMEKFAKCLEELGAINPNRDQAAAFFYAAKEAHRWAMEEIG